MNLFKQQQPPAVDLDELDQRVQEELHNQNSRYAAPRPPVERPVIPLQTIAKAIIRLTWADAVKMGDAIDALVKEGKPQTAAIQEWAAKEETFGE